MPLITSVANDPGTDSKKVPHKAIHYIDKAEFLAAMVKYKEAQAVALKKKKPKPQIPNYLATCLVKIAENLAHRPNYSRYTWKDIMVSDAVETCVRYFDNFDPKHAKKNPFGYFTQICMYAFWRRIYIEKKELYTKYKLAQQAGALDENQQADLAENGGDAIQDQVLFDNISEFIGKFEENLNKSKVKGKVKPKPKKIEKFLEE